MQAVKFTCFMLLLGMGALASADTTDENPIRKIVNMLKDMQGELEKEAATESELFDKAMCICETGEKELSAVIDQTSTESTRLTAKIDSDTALKAKLEKDLVMHAQDKVDTEASLKEATAIREKDAAKFAEEEKNNKFSISQLDGAIPLFSKKGALLQEKAEATMNVKKIMHASKYISPNKRGAILNFLDGARAVAQEPSSAAAEIIGMMKSMRDEMATDLAEMTKLEQGEAQGFVEMKKTKEVHLNTLMETLSDKQKRSGALALSLSEDKDALEDANDENADAIKYLASLKEQCEQRRKDRDMRNKMRNDEIAAISEAIKILNDDDALETFKKHVPSASLISEQARPAATWDALIQKGAVVAPTQHKQSSPKVLLNVRTVTTRAHRNADVPGNGVPSHLDPVGKNADQATKVVDFMINNMVETLHEDDVDDEHKKIWCQNETKVMHALHDSKEALSADLTKKIQVFDDEIEQLVADIKQIKADINSLDQDVFDTTALRKKEAMDFLESYQGMDTAVKIVQKAADRLAQFYSPNQAQQTSMLQRKHRAPLTGAARRLEAAGAELAAIQMHTSNERASEAAKNKVDPIELPDTPSTYTKSESGGVVGLMNKMMSEIKVEMREMEINEKHAAGGYKETMHEAKLQRAAFVKSLKDKKSTKAEKEEQRMQTNQQNELTIAEIKELDLYLAQVHAECDFLTRNYENRHEARISEEGGLQEAESIVTKQEVPSHNEIEKVYEEEHTDKQVDQHFPEQPIPTETPP